MPTHLVTVEFLKAVAEHGKRGATAQKSRRVVYACPGDHMGPVRKPARPSEAQPFVIKSGVDAVIVSCEPAPEGLPASTRPAYPEPAKPAKPAKGGK